MAEGDRGSYSFRRIAEDDLPRLVELYQASFGTPTTLDAVQRKFDTRAFGAEYVGYLAVTPEGELAAFYGVFPVRMRVNQQIVIGAQSGDTMTHPDHRRRGLFLQLAEQTYELARELQVKLVFGFPNENSLPGFERHLGWTFMPPMRTVTLRSRGPALGIRVRALTGRLRGASGDETALRRLSALELNDPSIELDAGLDGVVRDAAYLDYKARNSHSMVVRAGPLTVWLVPGQRLDIGGFREERPVSAEQLLDAFQRLLRLAGARSARFSYSADSAVLHKLQTFAEARSGQQVGYRVLDPSLTVRDLFFCRGDFDFF